MVLGVFFLNVLDIYKGKPEIHAQLERIVKDLDLSDPNKMQPMSKYNELLDWVDVNLGKANAKITGKKIGETIFHFLVSEKAITDDAKPIEVMKALAVLATNVIKDPKNRGWDIIVDENERIVMRKTQTFNTNIQFGVLEGLLFKCKSIRSPMVQLVKDVKKGDEFDEYELTWKSRLV